MYWRDWSSVVCSSDLIFYRVRAGNLSDAHAVENAVGRIILLNENRRIGCVEPLAKPFGVVAVAERANLYGKESRSGINSRRKHFHADGHNARSNRFYFAGGGKRKIDNAIVHKRSAVRDANNGGFAVAHIGDPHHRLERQRAMRRREFIHVVDLAVGSAPPVKRRSIPGRISFFRVADGSRP